MRKPLAFQLLLFLSSKSTKRQNAIILGVTMTECTSFLICSTPLISQLCEDRIQQKLLDVGSSQIRPVEQICPIRDDNWPVTRVIGNTTV